MRKYCGSRKKSGSTSCFNFDSSCFSCVSDMLKNFGQIDVCERGCSCSCSCCVDVWMEIVMDDGSLQQCILMLFEGFTQAAISLSQPIPTKYEAILVISVAAVKGLED